MGQEIERKFLVRDATIVAGRLGERLQQGYLRLRSPTIRLRCSATQAWLTIKGAATDRAGRVRAEYEYPLPLADARVLLARYAAGRCLEKTRYRIPHADRVWEVDVYHGALTGLLTAEVELADAAAPVELPPWVGREVTGVRGYSNAELATRRATPVRPTTESSTPC